MKSVRVILLALSATVSLSVLPSCSPLDRSGIINRVLYGDENGPASSTEENGPTSSSERYYDSEGYPIFGYDGEYAVYGYDPDSNPIYDRTQLDENSTVPDWAPLSDTSSSTASDSSTSDDSATQSSYGSQTDASGYQVMPWSKFTRRSATPPRSARFGYGRHLTRKPRRSNRVYGDSSSWAVDSEAEERMRQWHEAEAARRELRRLAAEELLRRRHEAEAARRELRRLAAEERLRLRHEAEAARRELRKYESEAGKHGSHRMDRRNREEKKSVDFKQKFRSKAGKPEAGKDVKSGKPRGKFRGNDEKDKKESSR